MAHTKSSDLIWMTQIFLGILLGSSLLRPCLTRAEGGNSGGGGDAATEMRIDEIRADILKWIDEGGAQGLTLPSNIDYKTYKKQMRDILAPHAVVIGAVTLAEEMATNDEELKVAVDGQPKTCRGFVSKKDSRPHILCQVERFLATAAADQYRLIHHEYAGLVELEQNDGASSDYLLSSQITGFLEAKTILRLAVKPVKAILTGVSSTSPTYKVYKPEYDKNMDFLCPALTAFRSPLGDFYSQLNRSGNTRFDCLDASLNGNSFEALITERKAPEKEDNVNWRDPEFRLWLITGERSDDLTSMKITSQTNVGYFGARGFARIAAMRVIPGTKLVLVSSLDERIFVFDVTGSTPVNRTIWKTPLKAGKTTDSNPNVNLFQADYDPTFREFTFERTDVSKKEKVEMCYRVQGESSISWFSNEHWGGPNNDAHCIWKDFFGRKLVRIDSTGSVVSLR